MIRDYFRTPHPCPSPARRGEGRSCRPMLRNWRLTLLLSLVGAGLVAFFFVPPFAQDAAYHNFADQRTLWNVPHALNVLSNLPFIVFGVWGAVYLLRQGDLWRRSAEATSEQ